MSRLYRQVAAQIAALIDTGEFGASDRLPAERHLSARLSVSRPTVREAIIALEIAGLVEVRAGSGVYVVDAPAARGIALDLIDRAGASPLDVIDARIDIECATVRRAASRATDGQLARIAASVSRMAGAENRDDYDEADREFHVTIAEATDNAVMTAIVETLWNEVASPLYARLSLVSGLASEHEQTTVGEHRAIAEALAARDGEGAEAAMRTHLQHVRAFLQRDWKEAEATGDCLDAAE